MRHRNLTSPPLLRRFVALWEPPWTLAALSLSCSPSLSCNQVASASSLFRELRHDLVCASRRGAMLEACGIQIWFNEAQNFVKSLAVVQIYFWVPLLFSLFFLYGLMVIICFWFKGARFVLD